MGRIVAAAAAIYSFMLIRTSIGGLPARIPTHFDFAGQADGWGNPNVLWLLFILQIVIGGSFLLVAPLAQRFPQMVHFGTRRLSDFTPRQRERILPLLNGMIEAPCALIAVLFAYLTHEIIRVASSPHPELFVGRALALFFVANAAVLVYYLRRVNAVADTPDFISGSIA